ncbi:mannonate dehydratase [Mangrovibacterium sp.]|uniref:mannonate dehydratase n=1 Tax=Mangrovibacterium sp. TaxID=1961364 RepID=UPI00356575D4
MGMEQTWRWYGPSDPVTLTDIRQAGATGIVTALHEIPIGEVWTLAALEERKRIIELNTAVNPPQPRGLTWSVIESIPVHEDVKQGKDTRDEWIEKYKESIRNVGKAGIPVLTYNWMPVVDWTRTNLELELSDGAKALEFNMSDYIAFDLFILRRKNAEEAYSKEQIEAARQKFESMSSEKQYILQKNIIAGLPGGQEGYSLDDFKERLAEYEGIDSQLYRENLKYFLEQIVPVAIESGVRLAIHPDDPPISLFGLPRVVSTESDLQFIVNVVDSIYNGLCICTGSLGVRADNDLPGIVERMGNKINFLHLRSTQRSIDGSFHEASHLKGNVDMYNVMVAVLKEQRKRQALNRRDDVIPMRADHGHTILDDLNKKTNPGYSAIGLLRGMAELRGLELGIEKSGVVFKS